MEAPHEMKKRRKAPHEGIDNVARQLTPVGIVVRQQNRDSLGGTFLGLGMNL